MAYEDFTKDFTNFVDDIAFPCLGAKSAQSRNNIEFFVGDNIQSSEQDGLLAKAVQNFVSRLTAESIFVSFIALFPNSSKLNEYEFEKSLWQRLEGMHNFDRLIHDWDPSVSNDPSSPHFSMSFGGKAFYIVGLREH